MPTSTPWPLRQALGLCLRELIMTDAIPAINANLASRLISVTGGGIVSFGDSNVILGAPLGISEPTICIGVARETLTPVASDAYRDVLETTISVKVPWAADNAPEDFGLVADVVLDNLRDLFTTAANYALQPTDPSGNPVLPGESKFTGCRITRIIRDPIATDSTGVSAMQGWTMWHYAETTIYLNR